MAEVDVKANLENALAYGDYCNLRFDREILRYSKVQAMHRRAGCLRRRATFQATLRVLDRMHHWNSQLDKLMRYFRDGQPFETEFKP